jgi:hypothetical protein
MNHATVVRHGPVASRQILSDCLHRLEWWLYRSSLNKGLRSRLRPTCIAVLCSIVSGAGCSLVGWLGRDRLYLSDVNARGSRGSRGSRAIALEWRHWRVSATILRLNRATGFHLSGRLGEHQHDIVFWRKHLGRASSNALGILSLLHCKQFAGILCVRLRGGNHYFGQRVLRMPVLRCCRHYRQFFVFVRLAVGRR